MKKILSYILILSIFLTPISFSYGTPLVVTDTATNITDNSAILRGRAVAGESGETIAYFRYSTMDIAPVFCNEIYGTNMVYTQDIKLGSSGGFAFSQKIENLKPDTVYYFCAIASDRKDIAYGNNTGGTLVQQFRTLPCETCDKTTVSTLDPVIVNSTSTSLRGSYGSTKSTRIYFEYRRVDEIQSVDLNNNLPSLNAFGWTETKKENRNANTYGKYNFLLKDLVPNTGYHFRAVVETTGTGASEKFYGETKTFKTPKSDRLSDTAPWNFVPEINPNNYGFNNNFTFSPISPGGIGGIGGINITPINPGGAIGGGSGGAGSGSGGIGSISIPGGGGTFTYGGGTFTTGNGLGSTGSGNGLVLSGGSGGTSGGSGGGISGGTGGVSGGSGGGISGGTGGGGTGGNVGTWTGTWNNGTGNGNWDGVGITNNSNSGTWTGGNGQNNKIFNTITGTGVWTTTNKTPVGTHSGTWSGTSPNTPDGSTSGTWNSPEGTSGTWNGIWKNGIGTGTWTGNGTPESTNSGTWVGNLGSGVRVFQGIAGKGTWEQTGIGPDGLPKFTWTGTSIIQPNGVNSNTWSSNVEGTGTWLGVWNNGLGSGTGIGGNPNLARGEWIGSEGNGSAIFSGITGNGVWTKDPKTGKITWTGDGITANLTDNNSGQDFDFSDLDTVDDRGLKIGSIAEPPVDAIVRYREGVETVFARQIVRNRALAERYGFRDGMDIQRFAWYLAHIFSRNFFGYVNDSFTREIRVRQPDVSAYELRLVGNTLIVYEYYKNVIIDIRTSTTEFKVRNAYEYYFFWRRR